MTKYRPAHEFVIFATWDAEAGAWSAHGDDIPGLVIEAENRDHLKSRVDDAAMDLIKLNKVHIDRDGGELRIVTGERVSVLAAA